MGWDLCFRCYCWFWVVDCVNSVVVVLKCFPLIGLFNVCLVLLWCTLRVWDWFYRFVLVMVVLMTGCFSVGFLVLI